jgi:uncharacterized PurR-regulated membrane protein YhhQ (DUF165 family)
MNRQLLHKQRLIFTVIIGIIIWSLLFFDYFNGGVPSHHILNNKDLPAISNWWGGFLVPALTWFLLYRLDIRLRKNGESDLPKSVYWGFFVALIFGIVLSTFFSFGNTTMPELMMESILLIALFYPIYRSECFLGFVLGMTYTFGGVLPVGIGAILAVIGVVIHSFIRPIFLFIFSKIIQKSHK